MGDGEAPGELDAEDVRGALMQRDQRRCGARPGRSDRGLELSDRGRGQRLDQRFPGGEPAVDGGAGYAGRLGDLLQAPDAGGWVRPGGRAGGHRDARSGADRRLGGPGGLGAQLAAAANVGQQEFVAGLIAFLASERALNIAGAGYRIDGGLVKTA